MPLHRAPHTGKEGRGAHAHSRRKDLSQFGREWLAGTAVHLVVCLLRAETESICTAPQAKVPKPIPRVAFCMTGFVQACSHACLRGLVLQRLGATVPDMRIVCRHVRSLHQSKNYHSLKYNMLDAFGADSKVFGYLKFDEFKSNKHDEVGPPSRVLPLPSMCDPLPA